MTMRAPRQTGLGRLIAFNARASRSEYWWMFAAASVLTIAYQASYIAVFGLPTEFAVSSTDEVSRAGAEGAVKTAFLFNGAVFVFCAILLPVTARRFKDCGWRGGWFRIAWVINLVNLVVIAFGVIASATGETPAPTPIGSSLGSSRWRCPFSACCGAAGSAFCARRHRPMPMVPCNL